jgi:hypothetical protein
MKAFATKWLYIIAQGFGPGGPGEKVPGLSAVVCGSIGTKEEKWHPAVSSLPE